MYQYQASLKRPTSWSRLLSSLTTTSPFVLEYSEQVSFYQIKYWQVVVLLSLLLFCNRACVRAKPCVGPFTPPSHVPDTAQLPNLIEETLRILPWHSRGTRLAFLCCRGRGHHTIYDLARSASESCQQLLISQQAS